MKLGQVSLAERNSAIVRLANTGLDTKKLAAMFGLTARRVRMILSEAGVEKGRPRKLSDEDVAVIKRRLNGGEPAAALAEQYGVSLKTIYAIRNGERRPRRRQTQLFFDSPPCHRPLSTCMGRGCYLAPKCKAAARYWAGRGLEAAQVTLGQRAFDLWVNFHLFSDGNQPGVEYAKSEPA